MILYNIAKSFTIVVPYCEFIDMLAGDRCLEFYYHMFGSSMGTLNAYLAVDGVPGTPVWTLSGNQGFAWKKASLTVSHAVNSQVKD